MKTFVAFLASGVAFVAAAAPASAGQIVAGWGFSTNFPSGDFGDFAGNGYGFAAQAVSYFGEGPLAFRVNGTGTWYGTKALGVSGGTGLGVDAEPQTFVLVGGPQLAKREGAFRPYVHALAGFAHFSTAAALTGGTSGRLTADEFQADVFAWSIGGGVLVPITGRLSLDLGARYTGTGDADIVGSSGFRRNADGSVEPLLEHAGLRAPEVVAGLTFAF